VGGIDDDDVHAGRDERFHPLLAVPYGSDRRADAQTAEIILACERMLGCLQNVLDGDQPLELEAIVDHQHALEPVLMHERLGVLELGALGDGDQLVAFGHDRGDRLVEVGLEPQVAIGDDADDLPAVDDGQGPRCGDDGSARAPRVPTSWAGS
jgi:hypothetical protein